jgi:hypothetical protein
MKMMNDYPIQVSYDLTIEEVDSNGLTLTSEIASVENWSPGRIDIEVDELPELIKTLQSLLAEMRG